jgi:PAS domain S-box-containing protein
MNIQEPENELLREQLKALKSELDVLAKKTSNQNPGTSRSTKQLQIVADLSRELSSLHNLEELLKTAVDHICKRFDLFYVAIYMLNNERTKAVLTASISSSSETIIPEQGYTFKVDDASIVSRSIEDGQARIAFYGGKKTAGLRNHILPEIRSEVLLPLMHHENAVGIMTMQSINPAAFTFDDIPAYQIMADQISIAVENASLFEQMNHERDLLHNIMDTIPDSVYFKDNESRFIRVSRAMAHLMGFTSPTEMLGKSDFDFFTQEHAQQAYDDEQKIITTATPIVGIEEKETWADDSRVTWVSTTKMPLRDNNGNILGTFGISRDITARKLAEEALEFRLAFEKHITTLSTQFINLDLKEIDKAISSELKSICEFGHAERGCMFELDTAGNTLQLTHEYCSRDVTPVSSARHSMEAVDYPFLFEKFRQLESFKCTDIQQLQGIGEEEHKHIVAAGAKAMIYVPLGYGGNLQYVIGIETVTNKAQWPDDAITLMTVIGEVFINTLARKKAEELLAQEQHLLHLLMDNIPDTLYFKDTECRFTRINNAQASVMGLSSPDDAVGKTDFDFFPYAKNILTTIKKSCEPDRDKSGRRNR